MRWPWLLRTSALLSLLGAGFAHSQEVCNWPTEIWRVSLSGERGDWEVRRDPAGGQLWLEPKALHPEETGYAAEHASCPADFVRLRPEMVWHFDDAQGVLEIQPNVALLPTYERRVTPLLQPLVGSWPVLSVPVEAIASGVGAERVAASLSVSPAYRAGRWQVEGNAQLHGSSAGFSVAGRANASFEVNPDLRLGGTLSYNGTNWTGEVRGQVQRLTGRVHAPLRLEVPVGAVVRVRVNDVLMQSIQVPAGTLVLRDIPLPMRAGRIRVELEEAGKSRVKEWSFPAASQALRRGDWLAGGQVWVNAAGIQGQIQADVGLSEHWLLSGQALVAHDLNAVNLAAHFNAEPHRLVLQGEWWRSGGQSQQRYGLKYQYVVGQWNLGLQGQWGTLPERNLLRANLGWQNQRWNVQAGAVWQAGETSVNASAQFRVRPNLSLSAAGWWSSSQQQLRLGLQWQPNKALSLQTEMQFAEEFKPQLALSYQWAENWVLAAHVQPHLSSVKVTGGTSAQIQARADSAGRWSVGGRSVYASAAGVQSWSRGQDTGFVVVHTGVPGLLLRLNGTPFGRTDARGDLLLSGIETGKLQVLSVQVDDLPIEVQVNDARISFTLEAGRASEIDWSKNFRRMLEVRFQSKVGQPASFGSVHAEGQEYALDELGRTLLPSDLSQAELRYEGGSCQVSWSGAAPLASCSAP